MYPNYYQEQHVHVPVPYQEQQQSPQAAACLGPGKGREGSDGIQISVGGLVALTDAAAQLQGDESE